MLSNSLSDFDMNKHSRGMDELRSRFDEIYDKCIVGCGFVESDEYYRLEKGRYWRSLELLSQLDIAAPARILEIGGGHLALLRKKLFGDDCTVADISTSYMAPLQKEGIEFVTLNLMDSRPDEIVGEFDVIILLEVVEHIPLPAHIVIERIKSFLKPSGILFVTTPNLFRIRNLIKMILGIEFLDRFTIPEPGQGLGHQLEYSADHLRWQLERAGMHVLTLKHDSMGRSGHSRWTRLGRWILAPLLLRPIWRDCLVAVARRKA